MQRARTPRSARRSRCSPRSSPSLFALRDGRPASSTCALQARDVPTVDSQLIESSAPFVSCCPRQARRRARAHAAEEGLAIFFFSMSGQSAPRSTRTGRLRRAVRDLPRHQVPAAATCTTTTALPARLQAVEGHLPDFAYDPKIPTSHARADGGHVRYAIIFERRSTSAPASSRVTQASASLSSPTDAKMVDAGLWARVDLLLGADKAKRTQETSSRSSRRRRRRCSAPRSASASSCSSTTSTCPRSRHTAPRRPWSCSGSSSTSAASTTGRSSSGRASPASSAGVRPPGGGKNVLTPRYVRHHTVRR